MIGRVVYAVLDLALLALITLAAFLLRAPRIDAAMADIPTDDWDQHCDQACQLGNETPDVPLFDLTPTDRLDFLLWRKELQT